MDVQPVGDLLAFHEFVAQKLHLGAGLSPEEVLDEWRSLHPDQAAIDEDLAAIQEALDDMEQGDTGIPFEEFDREFRRRHNFRDRA